MVKVEQRENKKRKRRGRPEKPLKIDDSPRNIVRALFGLPSTKFDRRVICDSLGFGEEIYVVVRRLSAKWCAEPSVHGGKKRKKSAGLAI